MVTDISQNPLLAAANAANNGTGADDDKLSDYVPDSRDLSMSRAVSLWLCGGGLLGLCGGAPRRALAL